MVANAIFRLSSDVLQGNLPFHHIGLVARDRRLEGTTGGIESYINRGEVGYAVNGKVDGILGKNNGESGAASWPAVDL